MIADRVIPSTHYGITTLLSYAVPFAMLFSLRQPLVGLGNRGTLSLTFVLRFALCERKPQNENLESTMLPPVLSVSKGRPGTLTQRVPGAPCPSSHCVSRTGKGLSKN